MNGRIDEFEYSIAEDEFKTLIIKDNDSAVELVFDYELDLLEIRIEEGLVIDAVHIKKDEDFVILPAGKDEIALILKKLSYENSEQLAQEIENRTLQYIDENPYIFEDTDQVAINEQKGPWD